MATTHLAPGYVKQGFSYARCGLYEGANWTKTKSPNAGYLANVPVTLISKNCSRSVASSFSPSNFKFEKTKFKRCCFSFEKEAYEEFEIRSNGSA